LNTIIYEYVIDGIITVTKLQFSVNDS